MHRARVGLLGCLVVLGCLAPPAAAAPTTTVQRTIQDCDGDNLLEYTFGEEHIEFDDPFEENEDECLREEGEGDELRLPPSASILNFLQLSDFQMVDEESPGRVEFLDGSQRFPGLQPFSAAYRPQESLTTQITEAMVRQVRNTHSPITGVGPEMAILTGDNADSQQYNETRWFIDILDGTDTGANPDPEAEAPGRPDADRKIDPNSGIPTAACKATGTVYDGVRNSGDSEVIGDMGYYEPDSSSGERDDGDGYSPDRTDNQREVQRDVTVRDFPGLFERANDPFEAVGLDIPWYSAFGNHDALVQGNSPEAYAGPLGAPTTETFDPVFHAIVTGCVKVKQPSPEALQEIRDLYATIGETPTDAQIATVLDKAQQTLEAACDPRDPECTFGGEAAVVPPDPRRCYLAKDDPFATASGSPCESGSWIRQHFRTTGTPVGHGFAPSDPADCARYGLDAAACEQAAREDGADPSLGRPPQAVAAHDGYYSFVPKPGLRFVVLDTVTDECGTPFCSEGSVDTPQYDWLREQIEAAATAGQYVMVFSHHTLRTTRFPTIDPTEQPQHDGERFDRQAGRPVGASPAPTLEELYCEHENVIAHIAGHEHENYVERHECSADTPPTPGPNPVFWNVSTAAHIDYPQQARMVELIDDGGQMSFVLTMLDHDGPANPGGAPAQSDQGHAAEDVLRLAGIGREIAYNDYQGSRGARGDREDRNVILPTGRNTPPEFGVDPEFTLDP